MIRNTLLFSALLFLFSCVDNKPVEENADVEVERAKVVQVLTIANGEAKPTSMQKGEFVAFTNNRLVGTQPRKILKTSGLEVTNKESQDGVTHLTFFEQAIDSISQPVKRYTREHFIKYAETTAKPDEDSNEPENNDPCSDSSEQSEMRDLRKRLYLANETIDCPVIKFYNLKSEVVVEPPPPAVRNRPDCRGLNPCEIKMNKISFDFEQKRSDGKKVRIRKIMKIASSLPFLARSVLDCSEMVIRLNFGTEEKPQFKAVKVKECMQLEDFRAGQST